MPTSNDAKIHVADVNELERLLPGKVRLLDEMAVLDGFETVWFVNENTDTIESGYIVNTHTSQYFTFSIYRDGEFFELIPTSDWLMCDAPERESVQ